jgi:hypothetical protein
LGGAAFAPVDQFEPAIEEGTTGQFWRGDKSWQAIPGIPSIASTSAVLKGDGTGNAIAAVAGTDHVAPNASITGATKTKITYDAKGLVTAGADATTADIADSSNKRYVTDANLVVIGNTSGANTGNQTSIVGITGTVAQFNTAITDGDLATGGGTATGTNTGDQTITLSGDASGSGTSGITATVTKINGVDQTTAWSTYTPTVASTAGTITTFGTLSGRYKVIGKTVIVSIVAPITTNGTGSGIMTATLPGTAGAGVYTMNGRETQAVGFGLCGSIQPGQDYISFNKSSDGTYPGGSGYTLVLTGVYESA